MGFRPGKVVDAISSIEGDEFGAWGGGSRRQGENVKTAISEDSKVLGSGDGETRFVKRAELDGVAVEWGFEDWHWWWYGDFCYFWPKVEE